MVEFLEKILALSLKQGLVYSQHSLAEERLLDTYIVVCDRAVKKSRSGKNGQNGPKTWFLDFLRKSRH